MSASRRSSLLLLAVVVLAALSSSACIDPQTLGTLRGVVTPTSMLQDPRIIELAERSAMYVKSWAAAATIVGLFWLYFRLRAGDHEALHSFVLHTTLAYALLVPTLSDALYWPRASVTVGRQLAELYPLTDWFSYGSHGGPTGDLVRYAHVGWQGVAALRARVAEGGDRRDQGFLEAEALDSYVATTWGALLVLLATTGSYLSALALQIFQAASVAVLSVVFPLMLPLLIVPWTRGLFWGYVRWLATVLLWGATFRILDAVTLTIHARSLIQPMLDAINGPIWGLAQIIPNYFAAGLIVHVALFALQLTAPGLAYALVHGVAQRSSH